MRIPLLERLPGIVNHLTTRIVNDSIFNNIAMGFVDTSPALRELTVQSMVTLAPAAVALDAAGAERAPWHLERGPPPPAWRSRATRQAIGPAPELRAPATARRWVAVQMDEEAAIRTNTTICLGKIAAHIDAATREKVLIAAFVRALKDPFPPARNAALLALTATQQCAALVLHRLCP